MSKVIVNYINQEEDLITLPVEKDEEVVFVLVGIVPGEKEILVELKSEGARAQILGLFIGHAGETKIKTVQHHQAPNTTSNLLSKTILLGPAKFDYKGLIKIDKKAQDSDAYQRNDNLFLHEKAKVDTKPELEILANEVRCTHGATVGKLDQEQIYYLMTRGLTRVEATQILLEGFLGEVIERIPNKGEREKLRQIVQKQFIQHLSRIPRGSAARDGAS